MAHPVHRTRGGTAAHPTWRSAVTAGGVVLALTAAAMSAAGPAAAHGTDSRLTPSTHFTLRRSRTDRMLGGVCGGLATSLGADAALLRVLVVALTVITGGAAAIVYAAAWVLAPEDE